MRNCTLTENPLSYYYFDGISNSSIQAEQSPEKLERDNQSKTRKEKGKAREEKKNGIPRSWQEQVK